MDAPRFKKAIIGQLPSAGEHNRLADTVNNLANSLHIEGIQDSTGFHTRRSPINIAGTPRIAYVKTAPGAVDTVDCFLDEDTVGEEVTVTCFIAQGGGALNAALPRLADGDGIMVSLIDEKYRCLTTFTPSEDCECYEA